MVLGGGSNILLTQNFKGTVLKNEIKGIEIVEETESYAVVKVGAGKYGISLFYGALKTT